MIEEKMEQREKKERKNNVIITVRGNIERGVEEGRLRKGDRGESCLNKSKLKERKGERMYICRSRSDKRRRVNTKKVKRGG
jgi:hypothetical protein